MYSLKTKISLMTVFALIVTVFAMSVLFVVYDKEKSNNILLLLCETGASNLNTYFNEAQKSVEDVSSFTQADVTALDDKELSAHVERVREHFGNVVKNTGGVLTYYYRIDPTVSENVKGFWYTNLDHEYSTVIISSRSTTCTVTIREMSFPSFCVMRIIRTEKR